MSGEAIEDLRMQVAALRDRLVGIRADLCELRQDLANLEDSTVRNVARLDQRMYSLTDRVDADVDALGVSIRNLTEATGAAFARAADDNGQLWIALTAVQP